MRSVILNRIIYWVLLGALTCGLLIGWTAPSSGQFSLSTDGQSTFQSPPYGVTRLGTIEVTAVKFNGETLFEIVAQTVPDRAKAGETIPVETRANLIEANLRRVVASSPIFERVSSQRNHREFGSATLQVNIAILGGQTVLMVSDSTRPQSFNLLTVTQLDADYYGLSIQELASLWRGTLQQALVRALETRKPQEILRRLQLAGVILVVAAIASFCLSFLQGFLKQRSDRLQEREVILDEEIKAALANVTSTSSVNRRLLMLAHSGKRITLEIRQGLVAFLRWLLFWVQILIWFLGVQMLLQATPYTQPLAGWLREMPLVVLIIWFATGAVNWVGNMLIDRLATIWRRNTLFAIEDAQRRSLRISTTIRALKGLKTFLVYTVGIVNILNVLGVSTGSVLALGAIFGVAVSFGSQSLVKDLVNGCLILLEDQYAIGDVIAVGTMSGLVENMNLRITQIRNNEGRLITIPNSAIAQVENLTRSWSRVDFAIEVSYDTSVDRALEVIRKVGYELYTDPAWHDRILESPEILGVDHLAHTGILIRVWIKTQPLQQWLVGREFRRQVHIAFQHHGIKIGVPQQVVAGELTSVPMHEASQSDAFSDRA